MKLPQTKDETDQLIFDLLEGNLSKQEEEFWYDYSLKDASFALQIESFRKSFLRDDLGLYPDHSDLLKRKGGYDWFKKPWAAVILVLLIGTGASILYFSSQNQTKQEAPTAPQNTPIISIPAQEKPKTNPIPTEGETLEAAEPHRISTMRPTQKEEEQKMEDKNELVLPTPAEAPNQVQVQEVIPMSKDTVAAPTINQEATPEVQPNQTTNANNNSMNEATKPTQTPKKERKSGINLKVKPSKKMKTSDFNY